MFNPYEDSDECNCKNCTKRYLDDFIDTSDDETSEPAEKYIRLIFPKSNQATTQNDIVRQPQNINPNVTTYNLNMFKQKMTKFDSDLDKLVLEMTNKASTIYESSVELRRKAQLRTEEKIADLKLVNGFNVDDDESSLPPELQSEIVSIQTKSDDLIQKTQDHEESLMAALVLSETKQKEIIAEINELKRLITHWTGILDQKGPILRTVLDTVKVELKNFSLNELNSRIALLPVNQKKLTFIEDNSENLQQIGKMFTTEVMTFEKLNIFRFSQIREVSKLVTLSTLQYVPLQNGTIAISGFNKESKKYKLLIFSPSERKVKNIKTFEFRIFNLYAEKNRLVICVKMNSSPNSNHKITIMDENLNETKSIEIPKSTELIGVNESYLHLFKSEFLKLTANLILYDWSLNKVESDISFQYNRPKNPYYINCFNKITKIENSNNRLIVSSESASTIWIFDQNGKLIKELDSGSFAIDSNNNIIVLKRNNLNYYDLDGEIIKYVTLKDEDKYNRKLVREMKISNEKLYFLQN
jgi:hypothetical protein